MNRPLVWVAVSMTGGAYAGALPWFPGLPVALAAYGAVVLLIVATRRNNVANPLAVTLACFASGILVWESHHAGPPGDSLGRYAADHRDTTLVLEGRVRWADLYLPLAEGEKDRYLHFVLEVDHVESLRESISLEGSVSVRWTGADSPVYVDDRIRVRGTLDHALGRVNPGVSGVEDYLRSRGVHSALRVRGHRGIEILERGRWWSLPYWLSRLRTAQGAALTRSVPEEVLPFVLAVWLGDRGELTREERDTFVKTGTAHILAVSGLHMAIVFVSVSYLMRVIIRNRRRRTIITMTVVWMFAVMAGARVGSVRAAVMVCLYLAADLVDREPDAPTALSIAAILFVAITPNMLFDTGFLLTFSSVASLLIFAEPLRVGFTHAVSLAGQGPLFILNTLRAAGTRPKVRDPLSSDRTFPALRGGLSTAIAVQILPLPLAIHFFHVLPILSPLANLLVVPLLTISLWLAFLTSACSLVVPAIAPLFGYALDPVVFLIHFITEKIAIQPGSHWVVTSPTAVSMMFYWTAVACAVALWKSTKGRWLWGLVFAACFGAAVLFWNPTPPPVEIVFLDVGHGDCAFIQNPDGSTVLIDGGGRNPYVDFGREVVAPFLWSRGVSRLDLVVASHPDADHMAGLLYVLENFEVGRILLGPISSERPLEQKFVALSEARAIEITRMGAGERISFDGTQLNVLHPPADWGEEHSVNDRSLVLRLHWEDLKILFTGDIEAEGEAALQTVDCRAEIMKVPHHGSSTSSAAFFIDAVRPRVAVVSAGRRPGGSVVSEGVLARYSKAGAKVLRTDRSGGIRLFRHKGAIRIEGERERRGYLHRE